MTGNESYHAHCFNCKVCKKRIEELVFAKTTQGIYCMDCHNARVARSRKHQERRERERREKSKERERERERARKEAREREREDANVKGGVAEAAAALEKPKPTEKAKASEKRISTMTEIQIMDKLRSVVSQEDPKTLYSTIKKIGQGYVCNWSFF